MRPSTIVVAITGGAITNIGAIIIIIIIITADAIPAVGDLRPSLHPRQATTIATGQLLV